MPTNLLVRRDLDVSYDGRSAARAVYRAAKVDARPPGVVWVVLCAENAQVDEDGAEDFDEVWVIEDGGVKRVLVVTLAYCSRE